jgi:hypothetical protein
MYTCSRGGRRKMTSNRKTAIIVGVLYIIGTVAGILSVVLTGPILDTPDYLVRTSANANQVIIGALFVLIMGLALAMVPVMMFPISRKHNEALALGYVVFRGALETVGYIATVICLLFLVTLSRAYVQAGAPDPSNFQALGTLLLDSKMIRFPFAIVFNLGALMFYYLLYQSKLIPRWISGWGLIAIIPNLAQPLLDMFGLIKSSSSTIDVLYLPMLVQEMVLAVWLIVKGFNPSVIASKSPHVE